MHRLYDLKNDRLIYIGKAATQQFWDNHWDVNNLRNELISSKKTWRKKLMAFVGFSENSVVRITKHYLREGSTILEGGCGKGQNIIALSNCGYVPIGIDYAQKTVEILKQVLPHLDIQLGDVRNLPVQDSSIDGYWSLGVIEHFWDGFDNIVKEMSRVTREKGYLFLTFPHMSWLRRQKVKYGYYEFYSDKDNLPDGFYQFALNPYQVCDRIKKYGFKLIKYHGEGGLKGLKDEIKVLHPMLQKLYDSPNSIARFFKFILEPLLKAWAGHMALMIFKKR